MNISSSPPVCIPRHVKDLTGQNFHHWTVTSFSHLHQRKNQKIAVWWCQCLCGETRQVVASSLKEGRSQSCGCGGNPFHKQELAAQKMFPFEYGAWRSMWYRCTNPNDQAFKHYGARGITVDSRWELFHVFIADMGPRSEGKYTLERRNNNGPYSKDNCQWTTQREQTRNTRRNHILTYHGITQCRADWAKELGITETTLKFRILEKWPIEDIFSPGRYGSRHRKLS